MLARETHFKCKDIDKLKTYRWKKIHHANRKHKKTGVDILTCDKKKKSNK